MEALMGENDDILSKAAELLTRVGTDTVWEAHCDEFYNNTHMVGAVAKWAAGDLRPTAEDGSVLLWSVFAHDESSFPVGAEPEARLASMAPALARLGKEQSATIARLTRERDDLYNIVNRTARALGIPGVDEDGATPSLHDVPERVAEVVRLAAVLRDPRILRRIDDVREGGGTSAANDLAADLLACMGAPPPAEPNRRTGRGVLNIVFCGEPPNLTFVEAETADGRSVRAGRWLTEGNFSVLALDSLLPAPFVSNEPADDEATQDPPGWSVCGKPIPGTERTVGRVTTAHGCIDEPGHDGPCRFDARADDGEG